MPIPSLVVERYKGLSLPAPSVKRFAELDIAAESVVLIKPRYEDEIVLPVSAVPILKFYYKYTNLFFSIS
jgi:hypothetical protein